MLEMFTACTKNASCICALTEIACVDTVKDLFGRDPDTKEIIYPKAICNSVHPFLKRLLEQQHFSLPSILSINSHAIRSDMLRGHRESSLSVLRKARWAKGRHLIFTGHGAIFMNKSKHRNIRMNISTFDPLGYLVSRGF